MLQAFCGHLRWNRGEIDRPFEVVGASVGQRLTNDGDWVILDEFVGRDFAGILVDELRAALCVINQSIDEDEDGGDDNNDKK